MRQFVSPLLALAFVGGLNTVSTAAPAQRIDLQPDHVGAISVDDEVLNFRLFDHTQEKSLSDDDLLTASSNHPADLAMVVFDAGLDEFQHLSPEFTSEHWSTKVHFSRAGKYQIWLQGTLAIEHLQFQTITPLTVTGGLPENSAPPHLKELRTATDADTKLTLSTTGIRAEHVARLTATIAHSDGSSQSLSSELNCKAAETPPFAIAVSDSGLDVRSLEIEAGADPEHFTLKVLLPKPVFYRLWIEFTEGCQVRRFPLVLLANR